MASSSFLPPTPPLSTDAFLLSPEPSPTTDGAIGAASWTRKPTLARVERKLGDSELSYYLPSRADGVNDMCVRDSFISNLSSSHVFPLTRRAGSHAHTHSRTHFIYVPNRQLTPLSFPQRYLYLGFSAPARVVTPERVAAVWTLLRLRHPLLASVVEMHAYDDVRYV